MVFIIGLPIFFAELFLGQYTGIGPNQAFHRIAPIFQGKHPQQKKNIQIINLTKF